jgi:hypothetical protein
MPRDLPIGNGHLLINFDADFRIRDIYYPFVGKENHAGGHPFRFGVMVDKDFRWVGRAEGWQIELAYEPGRLSLALPGWRVESWEGWSRGIPGGMAFVYLTECNWHGPNWLGQTCPACGAVVWERRGGRLDCHTCQVWWRDYDELDDARRVMTAADETIEVES